MSDSNPPKLERRFSLRTPLVFALLVLSGCGPSKEQQASDGDQALDATDPEGLQAAAIAAIEKLGGEVGVDDAGVVRTIDLCDTQITDAGLEHLEELTDLKWLDLSGTQVTDAGLEHLKGLTNLEGLHRLEGLTKLWELHLEGTRVTDAGLAHLKGLRRLRFLWLRGTQVTDAGLEHLQGLTSLERLHLNNTQVTDEGVQKFRQALPTCEIEYEPLPSGASP